MIYFTFYLIVRIGKTDRFSPYSLNFQETDRTHALTTWVPDLDSGLQR